MFIAAFAGPRAPESINKKFWVYASHVVCFGGWARCWVDTKGAIEGALNGVRVNPKRNHRPIIYSRDNIQVDWPAYVKCSPNAATNLVLGSGRQAKPVDCLFFWGSADSTLSAKCAARAAGIQVFEVGSHWNSQIFEFMNVRLQNARSAQSNQ